MARIVFAISAERQLDLTLEGRTLASAAQLEAFLREIEARAFRITMATVHDADEALDIVQESMIKLARRYSDRPSVEWPPLFYRILRNRTRDWHRRQAVRRRVFGLLDVGVEPARNVIEQAPASSNDEPLSRLEGEQAMSALEEALGSLPVRQREAFMLRNFEGLDVKDTAAAMRCTAGSVKTHYSRAVRRLRELLGEHWS
jgi:RNA polymerase sigma-70 factor (ECF subfamily)